jgi:GT2 family glycosyltransferase
MASDVPFDLMVTETRLSSSEVSAGAARRLAMEVAAERLGLRGEGIILTTDADSVVSPTWFAENLRCFNAGADCVAGYIDAEPAEIVYLGANFLQRGRLEDTYLRQVAEIYARCDPRPHDPWPNHRVSSGASLAVRLAAYRAIGGLPARALGEDSAFTTQLERFGFKVRHSLDVSVVTSCRLDGRATGGAADTMRHRHEVPDAECDDEFEPALFAWRRAILRGLLRKAWKERAVEGQLRRLRPARKLPSLTEHSNFESFWLDLNAGHPALRRVRLLRPSDLPREIAAARFILRHLRAVATPQDVPADNSPHALSFEPAI